MRFSLLKFIALLLIVIPHLLPETHATLLPIMVQDMCQPELLWSAIIESMILVTGGTGFVGNILIQNLLSQGKQVRTLVRPSKRSPNLPRSTSVEVVVCSITDERSLRASMKGVRFVYHLAGSEREGSRANLEEVDIEGSRKVANAARMAGVERLFFLSHLGADRASAYAVLKAKGIAEGLIQQSGIPYTILRSSVLFGEGDHFTTSFTQLLQISPGVLFIPGDSENLLQPLWVKDAVTCLLACQDDSNTIGKVISIGGPEYFSFRQTLDILSERMGIHRSYASINPDILRTLSLIFEQGTARFPISVHWLDYLASDRTCAVDSIPRQFGLLPSRFTQHLDYLQDYKKKRKYKR
jgi:NADH dehydrogenase